MKTRINNSVRLIVIVLVVCVFSAAAFGREVVRINRGGNVYFAHTDGFRNTSALTDSAGNLVESCENTYFGEPTFFDDQGEPVSGPNNNFVLFAGKYFDKETRFYWGNGRYYEPETSRSTSRGDSGMSGQPFISYIGPDSEEGTLITEMETGVPVLDWSWGMTQSGSLVSGFHVAGVAGGSDHDFASIVGGAGETTFGCDISATAAHRLYDEFAAIVLNAAQYGKYGGCVRGGVGTLTGNGNVVRILGALGVFRTGISTSDGALGVSRLGDVVVVKEILAALATTHSGWAQTDYNYLPRHSGLIWDDYYLSPRHSGWVLTPLPVSGMAGLSATLRRNPLIDDRKLITRMNKRGLQNAYMMAYLKLYDFVIQPDPDSIDVGPIELMALANMYDFVIQPDPDSIDVGPLELPAFMRLYGNRSKNTSRSQGLWNGRIW